MKNLLSTTLLILISIIGFAQTDGISYQAVIINDEPQEIPGLDISGNYLSEGDVVLQFTIYDSSNDIEFREIHYTKTDAFGMVNLVIGQGELTEDSPGEFFEIEWDGTLKNLLVELSYNGSSLEEFSFTELLFVPYAYHRNITATGTLIVDGETTLNSDLTVENGSTTYLTGELNVLNGSTTNLSGDLNVTDGSSTNLSGDLTVENGAPTYLTGDLTVDGTATFNGETVFNTITVEFESYLNGIVDIDGATTINNTLEVFEETTLNNTLDVGGQVTIDVDLDDNEGSMSSYPLRVQGSEQGIAIRIEEGTPDGSNNYVAFFDSSNNAIGAIEGQTESDLTSSAEYIFETASLSAEIVAAAVNIGLSLLPNGCAGVGVVACPPEPSVVAIAIAEEILAVANLAAYQIFAFSNLGVTYESGSADYAEWLERLRPNEVVQPGDIVGVYGGKISKQTEDANQLLVVSTNPSVLGNMPSSAREELYEKIAFMGQIPVKVRGGVSIGDYIIPSGLNDGTGIAVNPNKTAPENYNKIVGIAWTEAPMGSTLTYINMAIGLNTNDVANLVVEQQEIIADLEAAFNSLEARIAALENGTSAVEKPTEIVIKTEETTKYSATSDMPYAIYAEEVNEAILFLEDTYRSKGIDIESHAGLSRLFNDEVYRKEIIQNVIDNYEINKENISKMESRR